MQPFSDGSFRIDFSRVTGTVFDVGSSTSTHVTASGGGGYVQSGSGYIQPTTISSHTSTMLTFWLRDDANGQFPIHLKNTGVQLLVGHRVTLIYASNKDSVPVLALVVNQTIKTRWIVGNIRKLVNLAGLKDDVLVTIILMCFVGLWILTKFSLAFIVFLILFAPLTWVFNRLKNGIEKHIEVIAEEARCASY